MQELIDRQAALEIVMSYCPDDDGCCSKAGHDIREMLDEIEALPTIEQEVRHGRWVHHNGGYSDHFDCTVCGEDIVLTGKWKFCPNCGSDMREVSEDAES